MRKFRRPIEQRFYGGRVEESCIGIEGNDVVCASGRKYPLCAYDKKILLEQVEFVNEYKKNKT